MTILITGASSGIGQATAYKFATAGADLILTYFKNKSGAEKTKNKCLELGAKSVEIFKLDLSDNNDILDFTEKIIKQYKNIDILINNAGISTMGKITEVDFEIIQKQIDTNLTGVIKLTSKLLSNINQSIINIGSNLGLQGHSNMSTYSASKFGLRGFTQSIAQEFKKLKIYTVNPGLTSVARTDFKGLAVGKVAQIIFNSATGKYKAKSSSDININDYKYGQTFAKILPALRKLKNLLK